ncbi:FAD/NAD(P)-binding domain-containing protein [Aspergillus ambiguus]|uniref:FAD/NAD(P)-binding domain-containing protein n=1 Tax=Aspergillus ambiguus TaxID=176160 RepID=UPI003CCD8C47
MPFNVLIVGAGICGPAFAMLLQKSNPQHNITIVERFPTLRSTGQQIDLKTQAPHILRKMGLMDEIKRRCVNETGVEVVDSSDRRIAQFGAAASGQRGPGLTSEYEIMRGDMVQVLYDASIKQNENLRDGIRQGIRYIFGQTITALNQSAQGVDVTFSDGQTQQYDLVVGADGQYSRTRKLAFGQKVHDAAFKSLGIHAAYFSIPRIDGESTWARGHLAPGRKMVITRTSGRPVTGTLFFTMKESPALKACYKESVDIQKEAFVEAFKDITWQTGRLLSGLKASDDFYANELVQIKMDRLSTGRVVLLGDAGYCPSPFTGLGTNLCLVGAYVLAGELARQADDILEALTSYENRMRRFIEECQQLSSKTIGLLFPSSRLGVWSMDQLIWAVSKINGLFPQSQQEDKHDELLPEYPELNLSF